jgi:hypothetical protein
VLLAAVGHASLLFRDSRHKAGVRAFDLAARSAPFQIESSDAASARPLSLGATLPGISEAIQIFLVRFFNRLALTVAGPCVAFAAAREDGLITPELVDIFYFIRK